MSTPKILALVASCGECPHYTYYSGGVHQCRLVGETVLDKTTVAPFCPLSVYPSRVIAGMQMTIIGLREPLKYGFGLAMLSYVAAKLNLNLNARGSGITIPFRDMGKDRDVSLELDYVAGITVRPFEITFRNQEGAIFKLSPDANPPLLREAADKEGRLWSHHKLAA